MIAGSDTTTSRGRPVGDTQTDAPAPEGRRRGRGGIVLLVLSMLVLAAVAAGGYLAATSAEDRFESRAVLLMDQPRAIAATDGGAVIAKLSQLRLKYTGLVGTQELAERIADEAGTTADAVLGRVTATAAPDSLLVVVTARGDDRDETVALAEAASAALSGYVIDEHEREGIAPEDRFVLREVSPARGAAVDNSTRTNTLLVVAGLAAVGFVAAPAVYGARRRRDG